MSCPVASSPLSLNPAFKAPQSAQNVLSGLISYLQPVFGPHQGHPGAQWGQVSEALTSPLLFSPPGVHPSVNISQMPPLCQASTRNLPLRGPVCVGVVMSVPSGRSQEAGSLGDHVA